jgi:signal transduction histidine kinase/integral membrane sensor domain MASE1
MVARPVQRAGIRLLQVCGTAVAFSILNLASSSFQVSEGVSIVFPATAVAVYACMKFGPWAALGVFAGTVITPWESTPRIEPLLISGLINALEGLLPWLVFRRRPALSTDLRDFRSFLVFFFSGVLLNTALSALLGNLFLVERPAGEGLDLRGFLIWWAADFTAALLLATPLLAFGESIRDRFRSTPHHLPPRALGNSLQIIAVIIVLGWSTSAVIRNYLVTTFETRRLEHQGALSEASRITNQIHSNFLFAVGIEPGSSAAPNPAAAREIENARKTNETLLRELQPFAREGGDHVLSEFRTLQQLTGQWFADRATLSSRGQSREDHFGSTYIVGREVLAVKSAIELADARGWQEFTATRRRVMAISIFADAAVFLILLIAALELIFGMARPLGRLHAAIDRVRQRGTFDPSAARSNYAELEKLSQTLAETFATLEKREHELAEQTQRAIEASRHKTDFLAKMSHELRTPLNSIVGFSDLLIETPDVSQDKRGAFLQNIRRSGRHLLGLINDLLDIAKVESGRIQLDWQKVDLRQVVRNSVATTMPLVNRKRQQLVVDLPSEPIMVRADQTRMEQVVLNLLSNANKFSPEGTTITIRAERTEQGCSVEVHDEGLGIPAEYHEKVFEEFLQLSAPGRQTEGTGLGLALVKRLIEAQGGRVSLRSASGQGSTFLLTLPRSKNIED